MRPHPTRVLLLRRRHMAVLAALLLAAALFAAVTYPAAVAAGTTARQLPIYSVECSQPLCAISFDAAWGNEDTGQLIDILARYNVKTTFFVVGDWVDKYPESVKALHDAGHEVQNHSNRHDHYNTLTADEIIADVTACNEKIAAVTGVTPTLIRCPYGEYDDHVIAAIRSMGMEPIQWDVEQLETSESPCAPRVFTRFCPKFISKLTKKFTFAKMAHSVKHLENQEGPRSSIGQINRVCREFQPYIISRLNFSLAPVQTAFLYRQF